MGLMGSGTAIPATVLLRDLQEPQSGKVQVHLRAATSVTRTPPRPVGARAGSAHAEPRVSDGSREAEAEVVVAQRFVRTATAAEAALAAHPASGRPASRLATQPLLSPPGPGPASTCPMSVSLVVIRLELAEHSPVPADFGFSAAGESRGLAAFPVAWPGCRGSPSKGRAWGKAAARAFASGRIFRSG